MQLWTESCLLGPECLTFLLTLAFYSNVYVSSFVQLIKQLFGPSYDFMLFHRDFLPNGMETQRSLKHLFPVFNYRWEDSSKRELIFSFLDVLLTVLFCSEHRVCVLETTSCELHGNI